VGTPRKAERSGQQALQEAGAERHRPNHSASLDHEDWESLVLDAVIGADVSNPDP